VVSLEVDGKTREAPQGQPWWVIKGNKVLRAGEEFAVLTTDPATTPRTIDLKFLRPARVYEGIYAADGDTLKVCVNVQTDGVKERPLKLSTEGQPQWRLLVFERVKPGAGAEEAAGFVGIAIRRDKGRVAVGQVLPGSPAKKAGLRKDDIILKVGAAEPTTIREVVEEVMRTKPGGEVTFRVRRGGRERDITVRAGVAPFFLLD
jgi:uncharacterized protein (TIGR03067 family)